MTESDIKYADITESQILNIQILQRYKYITQADMTESDIEYTDITESQISNIQILQRYVYIQDMTD